MVNLKNFQELADLVKEGVSYNPDFIVTPGGEAIIIPEGATGPILVKNGKGFAYVGGSGGLNIQVYSVRVMDPTESKANGRIPAYPGGYVKYENLNKQAVDLTTGKTVSKRELHLALR